MTYRSIKYERIKKAVDRGIALNPHSVEVTEKGKILKNGGYEIINEVREIIAVVYPIRTNDINVDTSNKKASFINKNYEMICDCDADIKDDSRITTTIKCKEGHFSVTYINIIVVEEKVAGYQVGLERID